MGSRLLRRAAQLVRSRRRLGAPVSEENPRSSWPWRTPAMQRWLRDALVARAVFCAYGAKWAKPVHH
eukprot:9041446-Lingulodinium_polyedra.AAC.1